MSSDIAVTIEELEDAATGDIKCCVISVLRAFILGKQHVCKRKAIAMILLKCGGCGPTRRAVCRTHLWLIKKTWAHVTCNHCGMPGTWKSV